MSKKKIINFILMHQIQVLELDGMKEKGKVKTGQNLIAF